MSAVSAAVAVALAAVVGFSVHRASLCNVTGVAELLSTGRAHVLGSFVKTMLWVIVVTFIVERLLPSGAVRPAHLWAVSGQAVAGGFIFGVGAAVNGGCALGTLGRLGSGELRMLATLLGLLAGMTGAGAAQISGWLAVAETVDIAWSQPRFLTVVLPAAVAAWALWELWRLWRTRDAGSGWKQVALARKYRLSTAALLLGAANGALFARFGAWTYTRTAGDSLGHVLLGEPAPGPFRWVLIAGLLGGVVASSLARGDFAADWRPRAGWLVNLMGGTLMGVGAALTPGGNDALILHGIPGGSPHAIPAYAALLVGTAAGLIVIKRVTGMAVEVECSGDICRVKKESL
jgi:uncharacterized membrane protein YedE/YeeE